MITNPEALIIAEESQQAFVEMFKQYIRDVLELKNPDSDSTKTAILQNFLTSKFHRPKQQKPHYGRPFVVRFLVRTEKCFKFFRS